MVDGAWTDDPTTVKEAVKVFFEQHFRENEKEQHKFLIKELFLKEKVLNKNFQKDEEK